jgi:DNA-binding CsgD family transcriptional regulator
MTPWWLGVRGSKGLQHKRNIYMRLKVRSTVGLMHKFYGQKVEAHYG